MQDTPGVPLEDNPNAGGGQRWFPGKTLPSDTGLNNLVKLRVSLPGFAGQQVQLRALDVDDPSSNSHIDPNGAAGGDNLADYLEIPQYGGFHVGGGVYAQNTTVTLNGEGEAFVMFRVGLQPGNNYRVAAALVDDLGNFDSLQVANSAAENYVPSGGGQIAFGGTGALSPMLTVWRKLHLEFDAMENGPPATGDQKNYFEGTILERTLAGNVTNLRLRIESSWVLENNQFAGGRISIADFPEADANGQPQFLVSQFDQGTWSYGTYYIFYSWIQVATDPGADAVDKAFKLYDDDDKYLAALGLPPPLQNLPDGPSMVAAMQPKFDPAYIQLVDAASLGLNPDKRVPFRLNEASIYTFTSSVFDDAKNVEDESGFWAHTIVFGYQPLEGEDGDPDYPGENLKGGATPITLLTGARHGYSVVYLESVRERWAQQFVGLTDYALALAASNTAWSQTMRELQRAYLVWLIAHEVGHSPGTHSQGDNYAEGGIMSGGAIDAITDAGAVFSAPTVRRFRQEQSWRGH